MESDVKIDLITSDPQTSEYVLYVVQEKTDSLLDPNNILKHLQSRIYDAIEIAIDGHLAKKYPHSIGKKVRIQIDCYDDALVADVNKLIVNFQNLLENNPEYKNAISDSQYISSLRIVLRRGSQGMG